MKKVREGNPSGKEERSETVNIHPFFYQPFSIGKSCCKGGDNGGGRIVLRNNLPDRFIKRCIKRNLLGIPIPKNRKMNLLPEPLLDLPKESVPGDPWQKPSIYLKLNPGRDDIRFISSVHYGNGNRVVKNRPKKIFPFLIKKGEKKGEKRRTGENRYNFS